MAPFESFEVTTGGFAFQGVAAGPVDGRLVLFLHGWPQSSFEWRFQMAALAEAGYRAVAFDQRGYSPGARPQEVEAYGVKHLMADVLAVADDMGGHQFDVVGHDWGAALAWQLAARHPERVRTLTAVSVPHPKAFSKAMLSSDQAVRSAYMLAFRQTPGVAEKGLLAMSGAALKAIYSGLDDDAVDRYVALMQDGALRGGLCWYQAIGKDDVDDVGPVTVPTLFVWSTDDPAIGRKAAELCAEHVDGPYRFEVLEGVDHWVPEKAADDLSRLLIEHLSTLGE